MERLTYRVKSGRREGRATIGHGTPTENMMLIPDAIDRLAAYEDTGLGPEEITTEPYGCVFYFNRKCNLDGDFCAEGPECPYEIDAKTAKHLLELAHAEQDGRLVVLPPNDPLTLSQLQEMDGEPVWVVELNGYPPHWGLVYWCRKSKRNIVYVTINNGASVCAEVFMAAGGKIYRRKPEEVRND